MTGRMKPSDAIAFVPDDLPDGAYFAMLEEMTGMDAVDVFTSNDVSYSGIADRRNPQKDEVRKLIGKSDRRKLEQFGVLQANSFYHWQIRTNDKSSAVVADLWPHKSKFRVDGKTRFGTINELVKLLKAKGAK